MPSVTPGDLATEIIACVDAGARILNLSAALVSPSLGGHPELEGALNYAMQRGVLVVAAAGNQGILGSSAITRHPWVIPVVGYDLHSRPMDMSNLGRSIHSAG